MEHISTMVLVVDHIVFKHSIKNPLKDSERTFKGIVVKFFCYVFSYPVGIKHKAGLLAI